VTVDLGVRATIAAATTSTFGKLNKLFCFPRNYLLSGLTSRQASVVDGMAGIRSSDA